MGFITKQGIYQQTFYDVLMQQKLLESEFYYRHLGYGMYAFTHKAPGNRQFYLVNSRTKTVYDVLDASGAFNLFKRTDIDYSRIEDLPGIEVARRLEAPYTFYIGPFQNDTATVAWTIDPKLPTVLHAIINTEGQIIEKFK
ncbi:MAG: hypothetical protein IKX36_00910 [Prevotella sp.]|nr:hypothetical protein [Prevotella sp.]